MNFKRKLVSTIFISMSVLILILFSVACLPMTATEEAGTAETAETSATTNFLTNYGTWIWLAILGAAFYFLLIRPQRVKTKKSQEMMSALQRGDEIVTIGGFYGRIKDVRDDVVIVTVASGVDIKLSKGAISRKVTQQ
jgi:preprotein translocase YajC subunit